VLREAQREIFVYAAVEIGQLHVEGMHHYADRHAASLRG
jgi:hypothetical protein